MSGGNDYVNLKMSEVVQKLETLSNSLFIDRVNVNQHAETYLTLSPETLEKMTADELGVGESILSQYGLAVQRKLNRAKVLRNWAIKCIDRMIAQRYDAFDKYMKHEIRRMSISIDNDYAKRLDDIIMDQDLIIDELEYVTQSIHNISSSFANLARIRRGAQYRGD